MNPQENLLTVLRFASMGHKTILQNKKGYYKSGKSIKTKGWKEVSIESRIQYYLYGEFPLSAGALSDWDNYIKKAFKL